MATKIGYSIAEAQRASSLSRSTLYKLMRSGELESTKVHGRRVIPAAALHRLISGGHSDQAAA